MAGVFRPRLGTLSWGLRTCASARGDGTGVRVHSCGTVEEFLAVVCPRALTPPELREAGDRLQHFAVNHQTHIGPYVIERRLATGGMAEVVVARRVGPHGFTKRVALKRILPQYARDKEFVEMFISEAKLCSRISHPNIVQVFDFGDVHGELFLAMELVEGTTVNRLLRAAAAAGEVIPVDVVLHVVTETARALAYAHQLSDGAGQRLGFVHRDVSPANILLTELGHVKLTDFGIARISLGERRTEDGHVRGKLGYMSPEQVLGKELDGRSDVFTLSTVFAEMLLGQPLFGYGSDIDILTRIRDVDLRKANARLDALPKDVARLIRLGLAASPKERPQSHIFADACERLCRRQAVLHGPERLARLLAELKLISESALLSVPESAEVLGMVDTDSHAGASTREMMRRIGVTSPKEYRILDGDGAVTGPHSFPKVVQLITAGLVPDEARIAKGTGEFVSLASHRELERFAGSRALSWNEPHAQPPAHAGSLAGASLLFALFELVRRRATGLLLLVDGQRRKKIYLVNGQPDFIASTEEGELLGAYLVAQGLALPMEVEMALALLPRYGGRLGDALVGLGILRPIQLFRAISGQLQSRFISAFTWEVGTFAFYDGERANEESLPLGMDPVDLLLRAADVVPLSALRLALSDLGQAELRRAPYVDSTATAIAQLRLSEPLLAHFEVKCAVSNALEAVQSNVPEASRDELERHIYLLLASGLLIAAPGRTHPDFDSFPTRLQLPSAAGR